MGWVLIGICSFSIVVSMSGMFLGVFKLLRAKALDYWERRQKAKIEQVCEPYKISINQTKLEKIKEEIKEPVLETGLPPLLTAPVPAKPE